MEDCIHCKKALAEDDQAIKVFIFVQTFGMRPRMKSKAEYICFCPPCAASLAFGPCPEGALYEATWRRLRELVGADQAVSLLAWQKLHVDQAPPQLMAPADVVVEIMPALSAARAAS